MKVKRRPREMRPERDRALFAVLRAIKGLTNAEAAKGSGVSPQTIALWRRPVSVGGTKYPQFWTLNQVARAHGLEFKLVEMRETTSLQTERYSNKSSGARSSLGSHQSI